ncbi:MAG: glycosyltransferase family 2 protein [Bacteroidales bacterium]|nr:glycosyltransferase family 2 protein [Bacteroidales bacterium]
MIGFVVLHYLAYEMTLQCMESLLGIAGGKHIVVVDNASPGGSGQRLADHFAGQREVTVLSSPRNEGFARGNNLGYSYLREHFQCKFIVILNNDVLIQDTAFADKVEALYRETPFAVLGPDILNPATGVHQNPARTYGYSREEVQQLQERFRKKREHYDWRQFKWSIKKHFLHIPAPQPQETPWQQAQKDVVLHGSCYVLSQEFIQVREQAFNPGTFLYFEEDILHYECLQQGLTLLYSPQIQILHLEDVSTDKAFRSNARKEKMKLQESIRSMEVLLNLMNR